MPRCPRCATALQAADLGGVPLDLCPDCDGLLVEQRRVLGLLEALSDELGDAVDPDEPVEAVPDGGAAGACPRCAGPMAAFGYLGTRLVTLDRCGACAVLWIDPGELPAMVRLHARTSRRRDARARRSQQMEAELDALIRSTLRSRMAQRHLL